MGKCYGICFDNLDPYDHHITWSYGKIFKTEGAAVLELTELVAAIGDEKHLDLLRVYNEVKLHLDMVLIPIDAIHLKVEPIDIGRRTILGRRDEFFMYDDQEPEHTWGAVFEYEGKKHTLFWIEEYDFVD